jgi:hypothetical protein
MQSWNRTSTAAAMRLGAYVQTPAGHTPWVAGCRLCDPSIQGMPTICKIGILPSRGNPVDDQAIVAITAPPQSSAIDLESVLNMTRVIRYQHHIQSQSVGTDQRLRSPLSHKRDHSGAPKR